LACGCNGLALAARDLASDEVLEFCMPGRSDLARWSGIASDLSSM
jgi:hypothetical protein